MVRVVGRGDLDDGLGHRGRSKGGAQAKLSAHGVRLCGEGRRRGEKRTSEKFASKKKR